MRALHWNKLPANLVGLSVWAAMLTG